MKSNSSVVIFAPYFNNPRHVGVYRVERIIRWLKRKSFNVFVISSGLKPSVEKHSWGENIIVHSQILNFLDHLLKIGLKFYPIKIIYILLKFILKMVCIPDEEVIWARKVLKNKLVLDLSSKANFLFASSPLESVHVVSYKIGKKLSKPYIVDMRDGWLDESLKPNIFYNLLFRNNIEKKLEHNILSNSSLIFVSSNKWKNLLVSRKPFLESQIVIQTNTYPRDFNVEESNRANQNRNSLRILYLGRLTGSRKTQKADLLIQPIMKYFNNIEQNLQIEIFGNLRRDDIKSIGILNEESLNNGIEIISRTYVPRKDLISQVENSNGLLLMSVSQSAIPVKFYEYVLMKRPVLAITYKNSALWNACVDLPQFFLYEVGVENNFNKINTINFLTVCTSGNVNYKIPDEYKEEYVEKIFNKAIEKLV